jgi:hypothetical protein
MYFTTDTKTYQPVFGVYIMSNNNFVLVALLYQELDPLNSLSITWHVHIQILGIHRSLDAKQIIFTVATKCSKFSQLIMTMKSSY